MNIEKYLPPNVATEYGNKYQIPMHKNCKKYANKKRQMKGLAKTASEQFVQKLIRGIDLQKL